MRTHSTDHEQHYARKRRTGAMDWRSHHTHTQKENIQECSNYRPICITQIIYKIWANVHTNRLARTLNIATSIAKFGYASELITIHAIVKIARAIKTGPDSTSIVVVDPPKAFDCVRRQLLWAALRRAGLPITTMQRVKQGHRHTVLRCKENGTYGRPVEKKNVGVFQGPALSDRAYLSYIMTTRCKTTNHSTMLHIYRVE